MVNNMIYFATIKNLKKEKNTFFGLKSYSDSSFRHKFVEVKKDAQK